MWEIELLGVHFPFGGDEIVGIMILMLYNIQGQIYGNTENFLIRVYLKKISPNRKSA